MKKPIAAGSWSRVPRDAAKDRLLDGTALRVLIAYGGYVDEFGECFPSKREVAEGMGVSISTVHRAIRTLQKRGYVHQAPQRRRDGKGQSTNVTRLNFESTEIAGAADEFLTKQDDTSPHVSMVTRGVCRHADIPPMSHSVTPLCEQPKEQPKLTAHLRGRVKISPPEEARVASNDNSPGLTRQQMKRAWRNRMLTFVLNGWWFDECGPPPGDPACQAPSEAIAFLQKIRRQFGHVATSNGQRKGARQ